MAKYEHTLKYWLPQTALIILLLSTFMNGALLLGYALKGSNVFVQSAGLAIVSLSISFVCLLVTTVIFGKNFRTEWGRQISNRVALKSEIEAFASHPNHPYFLQVKDHMAALLSSGHAKDLEDAYDQAVWANPETRRLVRLDQSRAQ